MNFSFHLIRSVVNLTSISISTQVLLLLYYNCIGIRQIFDSQGKFLFKFGRHGSALGQFDRPAGICVAPSGNIVVVDKDNHRVQIFQADGTFVRAFGERGSYDGQFNYPWDVACNAQVSSENTITTPRALIHHYRTRFN